MSSFIPPATDTTEVAEWQGYATLSVIDTDGTKIEVGGFQKRTGGAVDSEEAKWGSGGMQPEVARGGRRTRDNIVLTRAYSPSRDGRHYEKLLPLVGRGAATVVDQVLDINRNVVDDHKASYTGILKKIDRGDYDDTSKDQRDFVIEISADA